MFKKTAVTAALIFTLMFVGGVWKAAAQQPEAENARKAEKPLNAYRLDFSVNEMEDGKR